MILTSEFIHAVHTDLLEWLLKNLRLWYLVFTSRQNLIDWIQEGWLQCCGIESPNDWDKNVYFNCSSASVGSREACGVPFSCCKLIFPQFNIYIYIKSKKYTYRYEFFVSAIGKPAGELIKNVQCGYDVRSPDYVSSKLIKTYSH